MPNVVEELANRGVEVGFPVIEDLDLSKARAIQDKGLPLVLTHMSNYGFDHEMVQPAVAVTSEDGLLKFGWSWKDLPTDAPSVKDRPTPEGILAAIAQNGVVDTASLATAKFWDTRPKHGMAEMEGV